jgi:hypothetical protein
MIRTVRPLEVGVTALTLLLTHAPVIGAAQSQVNALSPRKDTLDQPISLEVTVDAESFPGRQIKLICPWSTYQAQFHGRDGGRSLRIAISGTIEKIDGERYLISYDLEVRLADHRGKTRFSAAGSGLFSSGQPRRIFTVANKSVTLTATLIQSSPEPPTSSLEQNDEVQVYQQL